MTLDDPPYTLNFTSHGVLHHSSELILKHDGHGLGALSEEALEANNKYVWRYLELFSRKTSPIDQLTDAMNRLLERSHPEIVSNKYEMRPKRLCTICGSKKHSTRCHNRAVDFNAYDRIVHDILIDTSEFQWSNAHVTYQVSYVLIIVVLETVLKKLFMTFIYEFDDTFGRFVAYAIIISLYINLCNM